MQSQEGYPLLLEQFLHEDTDTDSATTHSGSSRSAVPQA